VSPVVSGNRFGGGPSYVRGIPDGRSGSRDRIPQINNNYQRKDPSPGTVFNRLAQGRNRSEPKEAE